MELTLGPVLFNWEPALWRDFYARIADEAPLERVCVGEVVCSKRTPFFADLLPEVVDRLRRAGKEVLLSSLALITLDRERRQAAELAEADGVLVEANDVTCLVHLGGRPHAIGPFVNVYNEATLSCLAGKGARRVCLPPELPASSIAAIARACPEVATEVWAFGRVPLAISARCYHARLHKLTKDGCQFVCAKDPDGLPVDTLDGQRFLALNGVQTLSDAYACLVEDLPLLDAAGVAACRLSPHSCDMVAVAATFRGVLDGALDPGRARQDLARICGDVPFTNDFLHGADRKSHARPDRAS